VLEFDEENNSRNVGIGGTALAMFEFRVAVKLTLLDECNCD
jgi:hypothetical protein